MSKESHRVRAKRHRRRQATRKAQDSGVKKTNVPKKVKGKDRKKSHDRRQKKRNENKKVKDVCKMIEEMNLKAQANTTPSTTQATGSKTQ